MQAPRAVSTAAYTGGAVMKQWDPSRLVPWEEYGRPLDEEDVRMEIAGFDPTRRAAVSPRAELGCADSPVRGSHGLRVRWTERRLCTAAARPKALRRDRKALRFLRLCPRTSSEF